MVRPAWIWESEGYRYVGWLIPDLYEDDAALD